MPLDITVKPDSRMFDVDVEKFNAFMRELTELAARHDFSVWRCEISQAAGGDAEGSFAELSVVFLHTPNAVAIPSKDA